MPQNLKKIVLWIALAMIAYAGIYAIGYRNSLPKIDSFCAAIGSSTMTDDLPRLADKYDVTLLGPYKGSQDLGTFIYVAASAYTVGEYRCSLEATVEHVMRKTLPNGSTLDVRSFLDTNLIQKAVELVLAIKEERGESAVIAEIQGCYKRIAAISNSGHNKADVCIAQDIAYSHFSDPSHRQPSDQSGSSQAAGNTSFTQPIAVDSRVRFALAGTGFSKLEAEERFKRLTQGVHDSLTPALKKLKKPQILEK